MNPNYFPWYGWPWYQPPPFYQQQQWPRMPQYGPMPYVPEYFLPPHQFPPNQAPDEPDLPGLGHPQYVENYDGPLDNPPFEGFVVPGWVWHWRDDDQGWRLLADDVNYRGTHEQIATKVGVDPQLLPRGWKVADGCPAGFVIPWGIERYFPGGRLPDGFKGVVGDVE